MLYILFMKANKVLVNFRLHPDTVAILREVSESTCRSQTGIVEEAVREKLAELVGGSEQGEGVENTGAGRKTANLARPEL